MINKKILGLLSVTCLGASAGSLQANMPNFLNGFYVGANVGIEAMHGKQKVTTDRANVAGGQNPDNSVGGLSSSGPVGGLYVGYDHLFSHGYAAGIEITGQIDNAQSKLRRDELSVGLAPILTLNSKFSRDNMWGAALRFGKHWGDLFLYGRVGWETSRFKHRLIETLPKQLAVTKKKYLNAVAPGIGIEKKVGPVWVRGEYIYSFYDTYKFNVDTKTNDGFIANGKINPSFSTFKIGITYKFCSPRS